MMQITKSSPDVQTTFPNVDSIPLAPGAVKATGKKQVEGNEDFALQMALAGAMVPTAVPTAPKKIEESELKGMEDKGAAQMNALAQVLGQAAQPTMTAEGTLKQGLISVPQTAERSKETSTTAASLNTAATVTGLKPWDRNWIFQGGDKNPDLKTLLGSDTDALKVALENFEQAPSTLVDALSRDTRGTDTGEVGALSQSQGETIGVTSEAFQALTGDTTEVPSNALTSKIRPRAAVETSGRQTLSLVSGSDFLRVRGAEDSESSSQKDGGEQTTSANGMAALQDARALKGAHGSQTLKPEVVSVNGHVVSGSMARERLSSDSVAGMSQQILRLNGNGGGEFHVRLKPEGLGEIQLRVSTAGNEVGLHIQATDEKAKRILEESLGSLRDALAGQNLNLGKVDVQTHLAALPTGAAEQRGGQESALNSQGQQHSAQSWDGKQQSQSDNRSNWESNGFNRGAPRPLATGFSAAPSRMASGRLDVHA